MADIYLGLDIGSTTVKVVVLDETRQLLDSRYLRSSGQPRQTLLRGIDDLGRSFDMTRVMGVGLTGSGGEQIAQIIGGTHVNELIAQTRAVGEFYPQARTVIEIGGQDSKFLSLAWDEPSQKMVLVDFAMNSLCAAGTGSFLDQQAERLGISIEHEFATLAMQSLNPSRIAGRCTVFAKSDMIHLQQKGTPLPDILAGLCLALARNFKGVIGKGKAFVAPILIQGGIAYNGGVVQAFERVLKLQPGELIVPANHQLMAAMGTAMVMMDERAAGHSAPFYGFDRLRDHVQYNREECKTMPPLRRATSASTVSPMSLPVARAPARAVSEPAQERAVGNDSISIPYDVLTMGQQRDMAHTNGTNGHSPTSPDDEHDVLPLERFAVRPYEWDGELPVYLGIDVGSISTNVVLIDEHAHMIARRYLHTAGRPLDAVRRALAEIADEVGERVRVLGVGTTGSGRYLTGDFVGADAVRNEISAQARAALAINPAVDTIFEIGGQDSKYISMHHGAVVDFAMNNACAAGTGSFLEEQADRLRLNIREDFSALALSAECPTCLGERCTVFMESDIVHHQQQGAQVQDLTAGLAYAIAQNYLNRVVNRRPVGQTVFFQGGVAANQSVVAAFEHLTGRHITVPPHHDVTGAIGAALLAMEAMAEQRLRDPATTSQFKGFDLGDRHYHSQVFECKACPNLCEISKVIIGEDAPIYYGARCDKFEEVGRQPPQRYAITSLGSELPDLFAERTRLLLGDYQEPPTKRPGRLRLGMPRTLVFYDMFPYWSTLFAELDIDIVLSDATNPHLANIAIEHATAETCFPVKLVYGHVINLIEKGVDAIFLPSVVNRENVAPGQTANNYCPYIPAASYLVTAQIDLPNHGIQPLHFPVHMMWQKVRKKELTELAHQLGVPPQRMISANAKADAAQQRFYRALRQRGQAILGQLGENDMAAVIVGRPYNTSDLAVCQDLPFKLRKHGILAIPMDFLPLEQIDLSDRYKTMYWRSGQDILAAAMIVRNDPRLQAVYVTSFNCGPDSFLLSFFSRILGDKPFLELEMDEHTADAGVITRCEAFFDSLSMGKGAIR